MNFLDRFDREEARDILLGFFVLFVALSVWWYVLNRNAPLWLVGVLGASISLTAFLGHEMMHRYVARRLGGISRFKLWPVGALIALISAPLGFVFAAPGAVYFSGIFDNERIGKVGYAGPLWNLLVGTVLYSIYLLLGKGLIAYIIGSVGALNLWFCLFNMIPVWMFDGAKIWRWNKEIYIITVAVAILLNVATGFVL